MTSPPQREHDAEEPTLGEVPDEIVGADLYPKHLEYLSRHDAFQDGVVSLPDADGAEQDVALDEVVSDSEVEDKDTHIRLRNGAIVVVSGAVIAGAIAALRYRQKHKDSGS